MQAISPEDLVDLHLGCWLPTKALWELIPAQATNWHRRLRGRHCGDEEDLAQAGRLAFWELLLKKGPEPDKVERVRELEALSVIDRAMWAQLKELRTGLWGRKKVEVKWSSVVGAESGPNEDQQYLSLRFLTAAAKAARRPNWEMLWLVKVQLWEPEWVCDYFRRKKDDRHRFTPANVRRRIKDASLRIRRKVPADLLAEMRRYSWASLWEYPPQSNPTPHQLTVSTSAGSQRT